MKKQIFDSAKIILLAGILVGGAAYVKAWTGPTLSPPNGNISAPLNVGSSTQTKLGSLIVNAATPIQNAIGLTVFGNSIFNGNLQILNGTQGSGKVLTSDASGNTTWTATSSLGISSGSTVNPSALAKAFVHAVKNGSNVYSIASSYNVSSISTSVVGGLLVLTVNFATPMTDANYASFAMATPYGLPAVTTETTTSYSVAIGNSASGGGFFPGDIDVLIF